MKADFPREARLLGARQFEAVYAGGKRIVVPPLHVRALRRDDEAERTGADAAPGTRSRLGLSVGKRIGRAVDRNRWKRAIRRAFRIHRHRLPAPYDLVIGVSWEAGAEEVRRVEEAFMVVVEQLCDGK